MAVYTPVSSEALSTFLMEYEIGPAIAQTPISEGVENTNYQITTEQDDFILTLFEKRTNAEDLPFFMALMEHLSRKGLPIAAPIPRKDGAYIGILCGRPAAIVEFLPGRAIESPRQSHAAAAGNILARMHRNVAGFAASRENPLSILGLQELVGDCAPSASQCAPDLDEFLVEELNVLKANWPTSLPRGVVHTDLFPDNVLFNGDNISGVIDFYFSATDYYAYDLAVTINAWCFNRHGAFDEDNAKAMVCAYQRQRALSESEIDALPILMRGAALRFLLTRLYDWLNRVDGALVTVKDPLPYRDIIKFHRDHYSPPLFGL